MVSNPASHMRKHGLLGRFTGFSGRQDKSRDVRRGRSVKEWRDIGHLTRCALKDRDVREPTFARTTDAKRTVRHTP